MSKTLDQGNHVWQKVAPLYIEYQTDITPLLIDVEQKWKEFPVQILNEIRAFTSHICRISVDNVDPQFVNTQISKAHSHILRIKLDLLKNICLWYAIQYEDHFPERYKDVYLDALILQNVSFPLLFQNSLQEARKIIQVGRLLEGDGKIAEAVGCYVEGLVIYRQLEETIESSNSQLFELRRTHRRKNWKQHIWSFILGIIVSVIGAYIWANFSR